MPRLELGRYFYHRILSPTRLRFRHTGLYYRSGGIRTHNPCLSRLPGLSRHCIPFPSTDRFIVREGLEPSRYFYHKTLILARLPITPPDVYIFISTGRLALPIPFGHGPLKPVCIHSITYCYIGTEGLEPTRNLIQKILNLPRINHFRHMPFTALLRFEQRTGDLESPRLTNYHIELYKKLRSPTCGNL